mmetsp:Transcript_37515/g.99864  ORF Transcript_37515/g.99864 Transcript_37515/m.99864 type:complete len:224 (+) Transcript_37515:1143-1814(+)
MSCHASITTPKAPDPRTCTASYLLRSLRGRSRCSAGVPFLAPISRRLAPRIDRRHSNTATPIPSNSPTTLPTTAPTTTDTETPSFDVDMICTLSSTPAGSPYCASCRFSWSAVTRCFTSAALSGVCDAMSEVTLTDAAVTRRVLLLTASTAASTIDPTSTPAEAASAELKLSCMEASKLALDSGSVTTTSTYVTEKHESILLDPAGEKELRGHDDLAADPPGQ